MTTSPRPPFTPIADPPQEVLAEARARFEAGQADLAQMARDFGMAVSTLKHRIRHRWAWQLHRAAPHRPRAKGARKSRSGEAVRARLGGSVRSMLARELTRLETEFAALPEDGDVERTTRVLANLVRILVAMARLDASPPRKSKREIHAAENDAPLDLARLRNDLARRLGAADQPGAPAGDRREPDAA